MEKKLVTINGIVGLIGGIYLLFAPLFTAGALIADLGSSANSGDVRVSSTITATFLPILIKIVVLVLGIMGASRLKNETKISAAPSVLLIVGGAVGLVPFFGFPGAIVTIVGGGMYLAKIKNFSNE